ncbi:glycosyl transferase (plasmid) [Arthrobacter sp. StoSoilB3]|nr:glycosyl transferase [Arthrobacter sp. StoSoilB3]
MLICDDRQLAMLPDVPYSKVNSPLSPRELFIARRINSLSPDVVFTPMQVIGRMGRKYGLVVTVHDLIYYEHRKPPGFLPWPIRLLWRLYHTMWWPQRILLNTADAVASVSRTTAGSIEKHQLTRRPIQLVTNAPPEGLIPRSINDVPEKSLVYMGSFMPYKNVETLIQSMKHLPDYTLHLLSRCDPRRKQTLQRLVPPHAKVIFHNGVSDDEYHTYLRRASALVTLSRAEGFGVPLVEAMALGTPVIASNIEIFQEIGGEAAIFVDPDDQASFAGAVRSLEDPERRRSLNTAALSQSHKYTWAKSAEQLISIASKVRKPAKNTHGPRSRAS